MSADVVWCGCGDGIPPEELKCATCRMLDEAGAHHPGIRSVVGTLLKHVDEYGVPPAGSDEYVAFLDEWCERLLKTTGFYREQQRDAA